MRAIDRLTLFLPELHAGGAERMVLDLARHWTQEGRQIDLVCASAAGPLRAQVPEGVRLVDLGAKRVFASVPRIAAYLRSNPERPCWSFLSHMNAAVLIAGRVLMNHPSPIAVQEVSRLQTGRDLRKPFRRRAVEVAIRALYRRADIIAAVSPDVADDIVQLARLPPSRVTVVMNAVDLSAIKRAGLAPFDHPFFGENGVSVLVSVARLAPEKDHENLLRAFLIARQSRRLRLLIVGDGPCRAQLMESAVTLGIADDVDFLGFDDNPWRIMARSDLLVLHSLAEGFGLVLVEAMACGTDVLSVACGAGPKLILTDPYFGPTPPVGDPQALATAILDKLAEPVLPASLATCAARFDIAERARTFIEMVAHGWEARYGTHQAHKSHL
uniref:Glycosyltransferase n=1 Tax=Bosea sp. NBC_00436 TaxID=2969620 RepID=A0A9E7ZY43_9HYPH